jgi:hypothetical protein
LDVRRKEWRVRPPSGLGAIRRWRQSNVGQSGQSFYNKAP